MLPFFSSGRTTAGRDRTGCTWPTIASEEGRLEPIDFHDFSISSRVKGERALPSSYPGRVLYDKNLIRTRGETRPSRSSPVCDQLYIIRYAGSMSYVTLFAPSTCSLRNKTASFSQREVHSS